MKSWSIFPENKGNKNNDGFYLVKKMTERKVKTQEKSFEKSLEELETLVRELETGKLPLEEGLSKFEQGVELYKSCKAVLEKAEKRIAILSKDLKEKIIDKDEADD